MLGVRVLQHIEDSFLFWEFIGEEFTACEVLSDLIP